LLLVLGQAVERIDLVKNFFIGNGFVERGERGTVRFGTQSLGKGTDAGGVVILLNMLSTKTQLAIYKKLLK